MSNRIFRCIFKRPPRRPALRLSLRVTLGLRGGFCAPQTAQDLPATNHIEPKFLHRRNVT